MARLQTILVLADLHIRAKGRTITGADPLTRVSAVLTHALTHHPDAAAMVLMGDLTDNGLPEEYAELAKLLAPVALPIIPMLGNCDDRRAFFAAFPNAPRTASGHVQSVHDLAHHRIITLDTLDDRAEAGHGGRLCRDRLAWLDQALAGATSRIPLVFTHHPAVPVGMPFLDGIRLAHPRRLLSRLAAHPGAQLFSAHVHRQISGSHRHVPFTIMASAWDQFTLDLARADDETQTGEPGGYGLLLLGPKGVIVHSQSVPPATHLRPNTPRPRTKNSRARIGTIGKPQA